MDKTRVDKASIQSEQFLACACMTVCVTVSEGIYLHVISSSVLFRVFVLCASVRFKLFLLSKLGISPHVKLTVFSKESQLRWSHDIPASLIPNEFVLCTLNLVYQEALSNQFK